MHSCAYFSFPCIEMLCKWNTSYQMVRASNLEYEELYFWLPWYDISSCDREQDYPSNNVHILQASKDPYLCVLGPMQLTLDHSVLLYVHCGSDNFSVLTPHCKQKTLVGNKKNPHNHQSANIVLTLLRQLRHVQPLHHGQQYIRHHSF